MSTRTRKRSDWSMRGVSSRSVRTLSLVNTLRPFPWGHGVCRADPPLILRGSARGSRPPSRLPRCPRDSPSKAPLPPGQNRRLWRVHVFVSSAKLWAA